MSGEFVDVTFEGEEPQRLDHFLVDTLAELSRARVQKLIKGGMVLVDGRPAKKSGQALEHGMHVHVELPPVKETELVPEDIPLDVIYESEDVLVINKPAGMVVHPSAGHETGTLVHAALAHAPEMEGVGGERRPGVVHRLDKDTSGVILLAKNDRTHHFLQEQFRDRTVEKVYLALVDGEPPTPTGVVDASIGRDVNNRKRMAVVPSHRGRESLTEYRTLERFREHTLLEALPKTGRTHQIRVHLAFIGCPIVSDRVYGRRKPSIKLKQHFLHAASIKILLPDEEEPRYFEAPLPQNLAVTVENLRRALG